MNPLTQPQRLCKWLALAAVGLTSLSGHAALIEPGPDEAILYYQRDDNQYDGWGLHLWNTASCSGSALATDWSQPHPASGFDTEHGAYYRIPLQTDASCLNLIMHKGNDKDLGGNDLQWRFSSLGKRVFSVSGSSTLSPEPIGPAPLTIDGARGHWLDARTLVVYGPHNAEQLELRYASDASIAVDGQARTISGGERLSLTPSRLSERLAKRFPHLVGHSVYRVAGKPAAIRAALKSQLLVVGYQQDAIEFVSQVQTPGVLDHLYRYRGKLGSQVGHHGVVFRLWAPTAQSVRLHLFDANKQPLADSPVTLREYHGVWRYVGPRRLDRAFYQYEVSTYHPSSGQIETTLVTDPYALSLAQNSRYAQVVNLDDSDLKPSGWDNVKHLPQKAPEASVIYETHIRDFSASDASIAAEQRGKYLAFTQTQSHGMRHLRSLAEAGLTHIQLLPAFDIATADENPAKQVNLDDSFSKLCELSAQAAEDWASYCNSGTIRQALERFDPAGPEAQALHSVLRNVDGFNWGYDPYHYTVPEGSYASDADGVTRIREFRQMVMALNQQGLSTVMDVVYNHTHASGLGEQSVLDKIVPGYYHRRHPLTGAVERSTCCDNTASEHAMMEKLMIDSLKVWARDYQVRGFRFDLMGHHMRRNLKRALRAVQHVDRDTYFYGEGWNFGEVANDARGVNATQLNMAGTGIGTFNDRQRDAVRGGGPFDGGDSLRRNQGFANGLFVIPNEHNSASDAEKAQLLRSLDWLRIGIAGGLRDYPLITADGRVQTGGQIDYNGQPAGYTQDPQETINYVSKHDNQTLWDINQYKLASSLTLPERVRLQLLGLAVPLLSQGIPFIHMGSDLLRSKSMERDSYDSGDWYNAVDFSYQQSNWNKGLPRADKDGDNWPLIRQIIADPQAAPDSVAIEAARQQFLTLLRIRHSSPLFSLPNAREVQRRLAFHNTGPEQIPGVVAFSLDDSRGAGRNLDRRYEGMMVILNASNVPVAIPGALPGFRLHPLQANSDAITQSANVSDGLFNVPPLTAAVFVLPEQRR